MAEPVILSISPRGRLFVEPALVPELAAGEPVRPSAPAGVAKAFAEGAAEGLLHLATAELTTALAADFEFARSLGRMYLTALCHAPVEGEAAALPAALPAPEEELAKMADAAPPMKGMEYLTPGVLLDWWTALDALVRSRIAQFPGGLSAYLRELNPAWRMLGRVTLHLAENKRDPEYPFAFLATYVSRLSAQAKAQHLPLGRALQEYAGAKNRQGLLKLLTPIHQAAERSELIKKLVDSGAIFSALAWTPRQAYQFLLQVPVLDESGVLVRVPDWWKAKSPPRPQVSVRVGEAGRSKLGADALLDFSVGVTLNGESLSDEEMQRILQSQGGLIPLRGQWIEVDREKLTAALEHWKKVERQAGDGISFFQGMRLLSGAAIGADDRPDGVAEELKEWTGIQPGEWLDQTLAKLRDPAAVDSVVPPELKADLRPYQKAGVNWLLFMIHLRLGACLADDMGLGKTVQMLAVLLSMRRDGPAGASLLVVPASLIANWKAEIARFSPDLSFIVAHPSESDLSDPAALARKIDACDLVITTYGMLQRTEWMRERTWRAVILDEAQAIKNSGARQTRAVKQLRSESRVALTGTPVENRLSDLWSLFDFLNPGLLGGAKAFGRFIKSLTQPPNPSYAPLRTLVRPYILRRLKTDKRIIADLPEKTEMTAWCGLSKAQAAMYQHAVEELDRALGEAEQGIQRRGIVLAFLMRFKQICNHPAQWSGGGDWTASLSGKFERLGELCREMAERQERVLIFTQFRQITEPLSDYLQEVFARPGLVLHGSTPIPRRREMVERFQRDDGPPFFILSLKAGGSGLNLTAASQVVHFDRWWNPAVENQATDRAFRIGQKKNVLVHKFVCRGTVEERIDGLIAEKIGLSRELLDEGAERLLTEMGNDELLRFVSLDVNSATI